MWNCRSREARLWCLAASLLVAYAVLAATGQILLRRLDAWGVLVPAVGLVVAISGAAAVAWAVRYRLTGLQWLALAATAGVFLAVVLWLDIVQERLHLVQYGVLAVVFDSALRERWSAREVIAEAAESAGWRRPGLWAVLLTAAAGWGDEGIQALLPTRYYDLRDVGLNALGGLIVVAGLAVVRRLDRT
jgi:hypothetical protein